MKNQSKLFQAKEQDQFPEINPNKRKLYDLPDREFKIGVTKMLTEVKRIVSENCNKEIENIFLKPNIN